jgi:hypothetical protein
VKWKLKGRHFQDVTEIREESLTVLHTVPKSRFQQCFQQWQKRWDTLKAKATSNIGKFSIHPRIKKRVFEIPGF